jgi:iron complex outermembrane receptor protein
MRKQLFLGVAAAALVIPGVAFAQSTSTVDFENSGDIVVTARTTKGIGGVEVSDTAKARGVLNQQFITTRTPGQSILDTINNLPAVSFQNNDPFGSAGGTLNIRGFDASRISLTFDGIPLNDTGNYAVYSNQQLDPELIDNVNVNFGSTDVDSPSAAATGSTVNYRVRNPTDQFGARLLASVGDFKYFRVFGVVDTGVFTSFGTKAWLSASRATNNWFLNNYGVIDKQQYNTKIYQPIGSNGDFISISGNYNQNRNNFGGSAPYRSDRNILNTTTGAVTGVRTAGTGSNNRFPDGFNELPYNVPPCNVQTANAGVADTANTCGTSFDERFNPSNTGSVRINSRFTLAQGLVLTVDPSYQYVKANGGGTVAAREGLRDINPAGGTATPTACNTAPQTATNNCQVGYFAGNPYVGRDLNGDGDLLDTVNILAPSQTQTYRWGVIAGLRYDISDTQTVRVGYTLDWGRHRQTGETGLLQINGVPFDVFPVNSPVTAPNGVVLEKRDRLSYAVLNQVSGQYRGQFLDKRLTVEAGLTAKFFTRNLTNNCFTSSASGFVECFGGDPTLQAALAGYNPTWAPPQTRSYHYNRLLPSAGLQFKANDALTVFANYSQGIQVPGTDNLYNAFFYGRTTNSANPKPEITDNFDLGVRYVTSNIQAQVGPWYTRYANRLASSFDPDTQTTTYRNLGRVDKYGVDGSISYKPIKEVQLYVFGSYLQSDIKTNVQVGTCSATVSALCPAGSVAGVTPIYALTAGKRESGAPVYTFGGSVRGMIGELSGGITAKRTGQRYVNDQNVAQLGCIGTLVNQFNCTGTTFAVSSKFAPAYTLVDLDARLGLGWAGLNKTTYLQLNVQNVFNQYFVGGFSGGTISQFASPQFAQIGYPRTFVVSLNAQF